MMVCPGQWIVHELFINALLSYRSTKRGGSPDTPSTGGRVSTRGSLRV